MTSQFGPLFGLLMSLKDKQNVTFHAEESSTNVVPNLSASPADPLFARDDIKAAAAKAWKSSTSGIKESEAGFFVKGGGDNIVLQEHPYTNQRLSITDTLPPNATAEVHVHPNRGQPDPSANDKRVADTHKIDVYTISRKGIYAYRPLTKKTEFLGELKGFIE